MPVFTDPLLIPLPVSPRIISLVPSLTELLSDLGLAGSIVGITRFCVHPASVYHTRTRVGGTKDVKTGMVSDLQPDLVIASREENIREQVEAIAGFTNVWLTDIRTLDDNIRLVREAGRLFGRPTDASRIAGGLESAFSFTPPVAIPAAYLIWRDPCMTVGGDTFIHDILTRAGFSNVFGSQLRYPVVDLELLRQAAPSVLLLSSEPYPFSRKHVDEYSALLPSVKVVLADGELFSWYGSRMLQAAPYLRQLREGIGDPS